MRSIPSRTAHIAPGLAAEAMVQVHVAADRKEAVFSLWKGHNPNTAATLGQRNIDTTCTMSARQQLIHPFGISALHCPLTHGRIPARTVCGMPHRKPIGHGSQIIHHRAPVPSTYEAVTYPAAYHRVVHEVLNSCDKAKSLCLPHRATVPYTRSNESTQGIGCTAHPARRGCRADRGWCYDIANHGADALAMRVPQQRRNSQAVQGLQDAAAQRIVVSWTIWRCDQPALPLAAKVEVLHRNVEMPSAPPRRVQTVLAL